MIHLYLLGSFHLIVDGKPITGFRSQKARALLAYLALEGTLPLARSYLAQLLWDGYELYTAQASLRGVLYNLRALLQPYDLLQRSRKWVQFQPGPSELWCDALALEVLFYGLHSSAAGDPLPGVQPSHGEFLTGFDEIDSQPFQVWLQERRAYYEQLRGRQAPAGNDTPTPLLRGQAALPPLHQPSVRQAGETQDSAHGPPTPGLNWDAVPDQGDFYGRQVELATLARWVLVDRCRLVTILGMGGQGKTSLVAQFVRSLAMLPAADQAVRPAGNAATFAKLLWRSLLNAPPLSEVLSVWLEELTSALLPRPLPSLDRLFDLLLLQLQRQRCLLVLDNAESIMTAGERAGRYRPGYEHYGQLLEWVGGRTHQSCLVVTSREEPYHLRLNESAAPLIRTLRLHGMTGLDGQTLLNRLGVRGGEQEVHQLVERYSGNPLALKLMAATISDLFSGKIEQFLTEDSFVFDDIRDILDHQFARLSPLEQLVLNWLAVERELITFDAMRANLVQSSSRRVVVETMRSLQRRMLLEQYDDRFGLQNVILEYLSDRLVEEMGQAIEQSVTASIEALLQSALNCYALVKAQVREYVRESQVRLLLHPVAEWLAGRWSKARLADHAQHTLRRLQTTAPLAPGYAAANLLHLLLHVQIDLRGYDFSWLALWQADLRHTDLPAVNVAGADLTGSVFLEPLDNVRALCFSPDGQFLLLGQANGDICVWRLADFQPHLLFRGHRNIVEWLAFHPDGTTLASASQDGTVRLWDNATGDCLAVLRGHTGSVLLVHFSAAAGKWISVGADGTVQVWDGATASLPGGRPQRRASFGDSNPFYEATAGGVVVATKWFDSVVRWWDVASGRLHRLQTEHSGVISHLAMDPTGALLATASVDDQSIHIWQADPLSESGWRLQRRLTGSVWQLAFSPDGKTLAGASHYVISLWDVETGQLLHRLSGHASRIMRLTFSLNSHTLVSAALDQTVRFWSVQSGQLDYVLHSHTFWVDNVICSPDGATLASSHFDYTVHLWGNTGEHRFTLGSHQGIVRALAYSPDGTLLATASDDRTVRLWDVYSGEHRHTLRGHTDIVRHLAFHPDGSLLATGGDDHTVILWDVGTGEQQQVLTGHAAWLNSVAFSPDGALVASGGDYTTHLWETATGQLRYTLRGHTDFVRCAAFSPDGRFLVTTDLDKMVCLWDVAQGQLCFVVESQGQNVAYVAFDTAGTTLVSANENQMIEVWDMQPDDRSLRRRHTLPEQIYQPSCVSMSPDGATLASGGLDGVVRVWDLATGQLHQALQGHTGLITAVSFGADGQTVSSSSSDGSVRIWDVPTGVNRHTLRPEAPYTGMNITGVTGITEAQRAALIALGAVADGEEPTDETDSPIVGNIPAEMN